MKIIVVFAIVGFILILFRDRIARFFTAQRNSVTAVKEEEEMLALLLEKYEKFETEALIEVLNGKVSDYEKRAIQIVLRKREATLYGS